ncbi:MULTISPECIES: hypothetical protein [Aphanothece]|uniref:hypothetical protein n=1 Tax=Aphanothece TaxID=1121 RepID=UPI00398E8FB6
MTPDLRTDLAGDDINIEALSAWRGNQLLVGLRKPAAEDGHAQALLLDPAVPEAAPTPLLFDLGGRRFRDCVRIDDQHFLILAGPKHDDDSDRKNKTKRPMFFWNGDLTSSEPIQPTRCRLDYGKLRAEGLCIRRKDQHGLEIFIGSDESAVDRRDPFKLRYATVSSIEQLLTDTIPTRKVRVELYGYD